MTNKEGIIREIETAGRSGRTVRGVPPYDLPFVIDQQETVVTPVGDQQLVAIERRTRSGHAGGTKGSVGYSY